MRGLASHRMVHARVHKTKQGLSKFDQNKREALNEGSDEDDKCFPTSADQGCSLQADICFLPENQIHKKIQGILY